MPERLPQFLTVRLPEDGTAAQNFPLDEPMPVDLLIASWRVCAITSRKLEKDPSLDRLRNLFWRLSNCRLTQRVSAASVIRLAHEVAQTSSLSHHSSGITDSRRGMSSRQAPTDKLPFPSQSGDGRGEIRPHNDSGDAATTPQCFSVPDQQLPRSILKQQAPADAIPPPSLSRKSSEKSDLKVNLDETQRQPATSIQSPRSPQTCSQGPSSPEKRRPGPVTATTGRSRIRPTFERRKSSQTSVPQVTLGQLQSEQIIPSSSRLSEGRKSSLSSPTIPEPSCELAPSSWQSEESEVAISPQTTPSNLKNPEFTLVDADFRKKFIEHQKRKESSTSLSSPERVRKNNSIVRFADDVVPTGGKKDMDVEADDAIKDSSTSDEENPMELRGEALPRTRSQLSFMIESHRRSSGGDALAMGSSHHGDDGAARSGPSETEQALLIMGRKGGVTKAGGVDPARRLDRGTRSSSIRE